MTRRKVLLYKHENNLNSGQNLNLFNVNVRALKKAEVNHINAVIKEGLQIKIASRFGGMINQGNRIIFSESKDKAQILVDSSDPYSQ